MITRKPKIEVWMLKETTGPWWFSFDPPTKKGARYWSVAGRRCVHLVEPRTNHSASAELKALRRVVRAAQAWERATITEVDSACRELSAAVQSISNRKGQK